MFYAVNINVSFKEPEYSTKLVKLILDKPAPFNITVQVKGNSKFCYSICYSKYVYIHTYMMYVCSDLFVHSYEFYACLMYYVITTSA